MVTTDFSPLASAAIPEAYRLLLRGGGEVVLVHVAAPTPLGLDPDRQNDLETTLLGLVPPGVENHAIRTRTFVTTDPSPGEAVVKAIRRFAPDLVVMSSHGRSGARTCPPRLRGRARRAAFGEAGAGGATSTDELTGTLHAGDQVMNTQRQASGSKATNATAALRERWQIDPAASTLRFALRHLVVGEIRGQFHRFGGALFLDRQDPARSSVEIWVDLDSIETGDPERDAHVRSAEFLDVAQFARATFKSTAVELSDEQVVLRGPLDLHGVVHPLELRVAPGPDRPRRRRGSAQPLQGPRGPRSPVLRAALEPGSGRGRRGRRRPHRSRSPSSR